MYDQTPRALNCGPTTAVSATKRRITARIHRTADGETHHEYVVDGKIVGSLEELQALAGRQT